MQEKLNKTQVYHIVIMPHSGSGCAAILIRLVGTMQLSDHSCNNYESRFTFISFLLFHFVQANYKTTRK